MLGSPPSPELVHLLRLPTHQTLTLTPSPHPGAPPSAFYEFSCSGDSGHWNHTVLVVLCLACLTRRDAPKVHLCCRGCQCSIPFYVEQDTMDHLFSIRSSTGGHWVLFYLFGCRGHVCASRDPGACTLVFTATLVETQISLLFWHTTQHGESSCLTRDRTCAPCIGSAESYHWTARETPRFIIFFFLVWIWPIEKTNTIVQV